MIAYIFAACFRMDTFEEVEYPPRLPPLFAEAPHESVNIHRGKTLTRAEFDRLLDQDGRLVDEHGLRKLVLRGVQFLSVLH